MLKIKNITMRNFLSVGNATQTVHFDRDPITLVLGENLDVGGAGSRNGVGKSTIVQALTFAMFGSPLTNIKKDNLVNKVNQKNMSVSIDFEKDGASYRVERGRKPNFIRYYVDDGIVNAPDTDESQGESKWTQLEIERVLGFGYDLFKHIVVLSIENIPFLKLSAKEQRDIIEELLGITQLSSKANQIKDLVKETKDQIREEEIRIKAMLEGNEKIQKMINDLEFKSGVWDREHQKKVDKLQRAITELEKVDIDHEIAQHAIMVEWTRLDQMVNRLSREADRTEKDMLREKSTLDRVESALAAAAEHSCPTCGQEVHDTKHDKILLELATQYEDVLARFQNLEAELTTQLPQLEQAVMELDELGERPVIYYETVNQAYEHRSSLDRLRREVEIEERQVNPYTEQVQNLRDSALQLPDYTMINEMTKLKDHQEFLHKLLTSKDSFIRKKIIDQNLSYLNHRLNSYLEKLNLPHEVCFSSDLGVQITLLGRDFDFEQLSSGEKKRVILALSWAFRDVWESMNQAVNLIFIDEIFDSGMDTQGVEAALEVMKKLARERTKNIFLISHREELQGRVSKMLLVQKENGFTQFVNDFDGDTGEDMEE